MADLPLVTTHPLGQASYQTVVLAAPARVLAASADPRHRSPEYVADFFGRLDGNLKELAELLEETGARQV